VKEFLYLLYSTYWQALFPFIYFFNLEGIFRHILIFVLIELKIVVVLFLIFYYNNNLSNSQLFIPISMHLSRLKVDGFRNLVGVDLSFDSSASTHVFVGPNGQGKTNLLESIYLCSLSKSFRSHKNQDLIAFNKDYYTVKCSMDDLELEVIGTRKPSRKVLKVNGLKKTALDFVGQFKTVFFSPDDLALMAFAPRMRRRYLDVLLSQIYPDYLHALSDYESARRQRNYLLKAIRHEGAQLDQLLYWDQQLARLGLKIFKARQAVMKDLEPLAQKHYQAISQQNVALHLSYFSELTGDTDEADYLERIQTLYPSDIAFGKTQLGPHRDDLLFLLNAIDMRLFASRGEWRSLLLSLNFAEIELLEVLSFTAPALLLDDVFSELDEERQHYLFDQMNNIQTFISTTHESFFREAKIDPQIFSVKAGHVLSI